MPWEEQDVFYEQGEGGSTGYWTKQRVWKDYDPNEDAEVLKTRSQTQRIRNQLQASRDRRLDDLIADGQFNADAALDALSNAFSMQSGDEWTPDTQRSKRTTLIAGAAANRTPYASSSALNNPVVASTAPTAKSADNRVRSPGAYQPPRSTAL